MSLPRSVSRTALSQPDRSKRPEPETGNKHLFLTRPQEERGGAGTIPTPTASSRTQSQPHDLKPPSPVRRAAVRGRARGQMTRRCTRLLSPPSRANAVLQRRSHGLLSPGGRRGRQVIQDYSGDTSFTGTPYLSAVDICVKHGLRPHPSAPHSPVAAIDGSPWSSIHDQIMSFGSLVNALLPFPERLSQQNIQEADEISYGEDTSSTDRSSVGWAESL